MVLRWMGMALILTSASALGFGAALQVKQTKEQLQQLHDALGILKCEMQYSMSTLPQLCSLAANVVKGPVRTLFLNFSRELCQRQTMEPAQAMRTAIAQTKRLQLPKEILFCLLELGQTLGQFDVEGQGAVLEQSRQRIQNCLHTYEQEAPRRCRSYQTLGVCAGLAVIILML